ncbi:asparaginase domain-containing protein [Aquimarina aggregata]|uniref:asparaginase domain-containing protein n=1 Tax=Aquimarina aggregata TaxID=1642818 RepID=UPI002493451B|nr:asparaginase domain-containing protein [Aquimarina aggregata]
MIKILTTGGTIEGLEYDKFNQAPSRAPVTILKHLQSIENLPSYSIKEIFSKDSRFITEGDRKLILQEINNTDSQRILITHGTYSMIETAQYLAKSERNRTIILTGAFILGNKLNTDAKANLHYAINQFNELEVGVFIAIHNETFHWNNVVKNEFKNRFETVTK